MIIHSLGVLSQVVHNYYRACALEVERCGGFICWFILGYISVSYLLLDERSSSLTLYLVESIERVYLLVIFFLVKDLHLDIVLG